MYNRKNMIKERNRIGEFWKSVEKTAASIRGLPSWMKAGIAVDRINFVTYNIPRSRYDVEK